MKIEKAKELIKQRGNESVGDTCALPMSPCILPFPRNPMAEPAEQAKLPIPDGPSMRNTGDPTIPRIPNYNRRPTTVPTAYKIIYRPKEGGGFTEERIPVHPIKAIGFSYPSGHMGATEEV